MKKIKLSRNIVIMALTLFMVSCASTPPPAPKIFPTSKEAECIEGIGGDRYRLLAWGIGETNDEAEDDALRCAVYSTLIQGSGTCATMVNASLQAQHSEFIKKFFTDGTWKSFIVSSNTGRIDPNKRLRLEDGRVKIGVDVVVNVRELRNYLIENKVLKRMGIGR